MYYLAMPSDFNKKSILQYAELNEKYSPNKVIETYGQITTAGINVSGRSAEHLIQVDLKQLEEYVCLSRKHGIDFNYTLNASCMSNYELTDEGIRTIQEFVMDLYNIGVTAFTVTLPKIIESIRSLNINAHIVVSTICAVISPQTAVHYKNMNVSRLVLDNDIIRDFKTIKDISTVFGGDIELIVNSSCLKGCPLKSFHYNAIAHTDNYTIKPLDFYESYCENIKNEDISVFMKQNWIRPEDLQLYTDAGVNYFKISGRKDISKRDPVRAAEYYLRGDYSGDLLSLISLFSEGKSFNCYLDNKQLDGFMNSIRDSVSGCTGVCDSCSLCTEYAKKALKPC